MKSKVAGQTTRFLNVDLDIYSRSKLDRLVAAFGDDVSVLYVGRERGRYSAHLEPSRYYKTADAAIRSLAALVYRLPPAKRKLWNAATTRDFNIGIESAAKARPFEIELAAATIRLVSSLNARVVVTVYCPGNEWRD